MPWYDDKDEIEQQYVYKQVQFTDPQMAFQEKNPYMCTLEIRVPPEEVPRLKTLYSPLLQWIDPMFKLLQIEEHAKLTPTIFNKNDETVDDREICSEHYLSTQSISVVLFLREETKYELNAQFAKNYLRSPPWVFHHKIELSSRTDMRSVARQEYYGSSPDLPLWTVCSIHYGNEQLRFNIFTKHFEEMKEFYSVLIGTEPSSSKPGFCTFDCYSQPGLDIKLSLKHSPFLHPYPTGSSALKFRIPDIVGVKNRLGLVLKRHGDSEWLVRDPDGNTVMLTGDYAIEWCEECQSDGQSDSGQWSETPSEDSSEDDICSELEDGDYFCESGCDCDCDCDSLVDCYCVSV